MRKPRLMTAASLSHEGLEAPALVQLAIQRNEGELTSTGALAVVTGRRTGRSPKDRFIVRDAITETTVDWGSVNQAFDPAHFNALWARAEYWLAGRDHFDSELHVGAHESYYLPVKVRCETAWHALFASNMFIRPAHYNPKERAEWEVINVPGFVCEPERDHTHSEAAVMLNFGKLCTSRTTIDW